MNTIRARVILTCLCLLLSVSGCDCGGGETGGGGGDGGTTPGDGGWNSNDAIVVLDGGVIIDEDGGTSYVCYRTICDGHETECGDCEDNDSDGRTDWRDRECLGPCDNTEGPALVTGVAGTPENNCTLDCYFEFGSGSGSGDCQWDHRCDPFAVAPDYPPHGDDCRYEDRNHPSVHCPEPQADTCLDSCQPLTPNGCDCFGCCTFPELAGRSAAEGGEHVWLGSVDGNDGTCTFATVTDTSACHPCTPVTDCSNDCRHCELCLGKNELPADCIPPDGGTTEDGGTPTDGGAVAPPDGGYERCVEGRQPCGLPGDQDCASGYYCITGCCAYILI